MSYPSCQEAGAQALTLPGQLAACHIHQVPGQVSTTLYLSIEEGWGGGGGLGLVQGERGSHSPKDPGLILYLTLSFPFLQEWEEL